MVPIMGRRFTTVLISLVVFTCQWLMPAPAHAAMDVAKQVLIGADYSNKDLQGATFNLSNLREANLSGSDLRGASLYGAKLQDADLSGTDLREATLDAAVMTGTNLEDAVLEGHLQHPLQRCVDHGGRLHRRSHARGPTQKPLRRCRRNEFRHGPQHRRKSRLRLNHEFDPRGLERLRELRASNSLHACRNRRSLRRLPKPARCAIALKQEKDELCPRRRSQPGRHRS